MDFLEWLSEAFSGILDSIFNFLPKSPIMFLEANDSISKLMSYINWFIPIYLWIGILETWLVCIFTYYVAQPILRWIKIIN